MSEMVERVARILDPEAWAPRYAQMASTPQQPINQNMMVQTYAPGAHLDQFERQRRQDASITQARRVIAAMREPTAAIVLSGAKAAVDQHYYKRDSWDRGYIGDAAKEDWLNGARFGWYAMIDAAIAHQG